MKHIIVGTAGHIDHGKTALVKALTGVDADRLKEEKQRGITIDIGFADLTLGDLHVGFVDVPGHERFVKNMLAGAHGLDLVMLVIAADEAVMPQTREHFDICRLLQVKSGLIALTKADLVDDELLELARAEVEEYVSGSFLEGAPILPVSSRTLAGIEELKNALTQLAAGVEPKTAAATPRLPVDRAFSIKGFGTVVTGTLIAGELHAAEDIEILPAGARSRVRNLQVHGHDTNVARAGQRTAINLQGVSREAVERGSVLTLAGRLRPTSMIDVRLELLASAPRPLRHRSRVRLHHGTAEVMARLTILGRAATPEANADEANADGKAGLAALVLKPGSADVVQLRLESPIVALPGDRFIIRSYSPQVTIGGGVVLDALPQKHRLRDYEARAALEQLAIIALRVQDAARAAHDEDAARAAHDEDAARERAVIFLELAGNRGLTAAELIARLGATDEQIKELAATLLQTHRAVEVASAPLRLLARAAFEQLATAVTQLLAAHHRGAPLSIGISREELRERLFGTLATETFRAVINRLVECGSVAAERDTLRLATHKPALAGADAEMKAALEAAFESAGLQAVTLDEAAGRLKLNGNQARQLYQLLLAEKRLVRVGDFVFHAQVIEDLKARLRLRKAVSPKMDVAVFKELTGGLSRKHAIPLLEFLDRERVTRRVGNEREIL